MPLVGSSTSLNALLQTFLAKTPIKNKLKKPLHPTAGRVLPPTVIYNCTAGQQTAVKDTFRRVTTSYIPIIRSWGGAGPTLATRLAERNLDNTWVGCKNCAPFPSLSFLDGGNGDPEIRVCTPVPPYEADFKRFLFQELLFLAGANVFDVLIVQAYFRSWETWHGSVPVGKWDSPVGGFFELCRGRRLSASGAYAATYAGNYMVWTPWQAAVYVGNTFIPSQPGMQLWSQSNWSAVC